MAREQETMNGIVGYLPGPETGEKASDPLIHLTTISGGSFMFRELRIMRSKKCSILPRFQPDFISIGSNVASRGLLRRILRRNSVVKK